MIFMAGKTLALAAAAAAAVALYLHHRGSNEYTALAAALRLRITSTAFRSGCSSRSIVHDSPGAAAAAACYMSITNQTIEPLAASTPQAYFQTQLPLWALWGLQSRSQTHVT